MFQAPPPPPPPGPPPPPPNGLAVAEQDLLELAEPGIQQDITNIDLAVGELINDQQIAFPEKRRIFLEHDDKLQEYEEKVYKAIKKAHEEYSAASFAHYKLEIKQHFMALDKKAQETLRVDFFRTEVLDKDEFPNESIEALRKRLTESVKKSEKQKKEKNNLLVSAKKVLERIQQAQENIKVAIFEQEVSELPDNDKFRRVKKAFSDLKNKSDALDREKTSTEADLKLNNEDISVKVREHTVGSQKIMETMASFIEAVLIDDPDDVVNPLVLKEEAKARMQEDIHSFRTIEDLKHKSFELEDRESLNQIKFYLQRKKMVVWLKQKDKIEKAIKAVENNKKDFKVGKISFGFVKENALGDLKEISSENLAKLPWIVLNQNGTYDAVINISKKAFRIRLEKEEFKNFLGDFVENHPLEQRKDLDQEHAIWKFIKSESDKLQPMKMSARDLAIMREPNHKMASEYYKITEKSKYQITEVLKIARKLDIPIADEDLFKKVEKELKALLELNPQSAPKKIDGKAGRTFLEKTLGIEDIEEAFNARQARPILRKKLPEVERMILNNEEYYDLAVATKYRWEDLAKIAAALNLKMDDDNILVQVQAVLEAALKTDQANPERWTENQKIKGEYPRAFLERILGFDVITEFEKREAKLLLAEEKPKQDERKNAAAGGVQGARVAGGADPEILNRYKAQVEEAEKKIEAEKARADKLAEELARAPQRQLTQAEKRALRNKW